MKLKVYTGDEPSPVILEGEQIRLRLRPSTVTPKAGFASVVDGRATTNIEAVIDGTRRDFTYVTAVEIEETP